MMKEVNKYERIKMMFNTERFLHVDDVIFRKKKRSNFFINLNIHMEKNVKEHLCLIIQ